jgi:hypothetical protein
VNEPVWSLRARFSSATIDFRFLSRAHLDHARSDSIVDDIIVAVVAGASLNTSSFSLQGRLDCAFPRSALERSGSIDDTGGPHLLTL